MAEDGLAHRDAAEAGTRLQPHETTRTTLRPIPAVPGIEPAGGGGSRGLFVLRGLAGRRLASRRRGGQRLVPWVMVVPGLLFLLFFHFFAQSEGAWYAFTSWDGVGAAKWIGLANFRHIWESTVARGALWNTLKLAAGCLVVTNVLGLALALALNRTVKTRNALRSLFFLPVVLSPLASAYIWEYIFDYRGAFNQLLGAVGLSSWERAWLGDPHWAIWTVFVVLVWQYTGLAMVIFLAGLQGIPQELDEAGAVDGASAWLRFRRVTLPLLAPAITVSATLTLIWGLRSFDQIIALTGGGPDNATETLATQVYEQTWENGLFGYGSSLALVLSGLVLVMAIGQLMILRVREARI